VSKVIVMESVENKNGERVCVNVQTIRVDLSAMEVLDHLRDHEQRIADVKMGRFKQMV